MLKIANEIAMHELLSLGKDVFMLVHIPFDNLAFLDFSFLQTAY